MTLARTTSVAVLGVEGQLVEIQADLADGLPGVTMIGLPDAALQEARDRIRAAIVNSGETWPAPGCGSSTATGGAPRASSTSSPRTTARWSSAR